MARTATATSRWQNFLSSSLRRRLRVGPVAARAYAFRRGCPRPELLPERHDQRIGLRPRGSGEDRQNLLPLLERQSNLNHLIHPCGSKHSEPIATRAWPQSAVPPPPAKSAHRYSVTMQTPEPPLPPRVVVAVKSWLMHAPWPPAPLLGKAALPGCAPPLPVMPAALPPLIWPPMPPTAATNSLVGMSIIGPDMPPAP